MAEGGIPLVELERDITHPYDDIDNVNDLQDILNGSKYEDAWAADMKNRIESLKKDKNNTKELEKMKVELTDQNYNRLKQLFRNKYPNADLTSLELLKLPDSKNPGNKITSKSDIRRRIICKNGDFFLRAPDSI